MDTNNFIAKEVAYVTNVVSLGGPGDVEYILEVCQDHVGMVEPEMTIDMGVKVAEAYFKSKGQDYIEFPDYSVFLRFVREYKPSLNLEVNLCIANTVFNSIIQCLESFEE